jgi:hypothetical protein
VVTVSRLTLLCKYGSTQYFSPAKSCRGEQPSAGNAPPHTLYLISPATTPHFTSKAITHHHHHHHHHHYLNSLYNKQSTDCSASPPSPPSAPISIHGIKTKLIWCGATSSGAPSPPPPLLLRQSSFMLCVSAGVCYTRKPLQPKAPCSTSLACGPHLPPKLNTHSPTPDSRLNAGV